MKGNAKCHIPSNKYRDNYDGVFGKNNLDDTCGDCKFFSGYGDMGYGECVNKVSAIMIDKDGVGSYIVVAGDTEACIFFLGDNVDQI